MPMTCTLSSALSLLGMCYLCWHLAYHASVVMMVLPFLFSSSFSLNNLGLPPETVTLPSTWSPHWLYLHLSSLFRSAYNKTIPLKQWQNTFLYISELGNFPQTVVSNPVPFSEHPSTHIVSPPWGSWPTCDCSCTDTLPILISWMTHKLPEYSVGGVEVCLFFFFF